MVSGGGAVKNLRVKSGTGTIDRIAARSPKCHRAMASLVDQIDAPVEGIDRRLKIRLGQNRTWMSEGVDLDA